MMTKEQAMNLAKWLKEQRAKRNLSQVTLAEFINVGVTTVRNWEHGHASRNYTRHGLRYFFDEWDKSATHEIPVEAPALATGEWLRWRLKTDGIRVAELAEYLGIRQSCVYNWMNSCKTIPLIAEYAIRQAIKDLGK